MADRIKLLDLYINVKELESDLKKAIQTIEELTRKVRLARQAFNQNKQAQDTLREGLKKLNEQNQSNNSVYKEGTETLKRLENAEKQLLETLSNEITALKKAQEQYGQLKKAADALNSSTLKQKIQTGELTKAKKRQMQEELGIRGAYDKLNARYIQSKRTLADLLAAENRNTEAIKRARAEYEKLRGRVLAVDRATNNYTKNIGNYSSAWKGFGNVMQGFGGVVGAVGGVLSGLGIAYAATAGVRALVRVIKDGIKTVKEFEKANATLAAVLQTEKTAISALRNDAIRLSKIYTQSAVEVTELQVAFSRLGFSQNQILDVTEATVQGATALNSSLDETATLIGAVIKTFDNLSTTDAPHVLDVLSLATATSALNFEKLQTALPLVQGGANALGVSLEEVVALLGKVVDKGIPASIAARALNRVFLDSAKKGLNYSEALETLNTKFNKFVAADENFGKRAAVTATVLANDIDKIKVYSTELSHAAGVTKDMADKELDTLDGQLHRLSNSWDDLIIALDDTTGVSNKLRDSTRFLTAVLNTLSEKITDISDTSLDKANKALNKYNENAEKNIDTLRKYVKIAADTSKSDQAREKALKELNSMMFDVDKSFTRANITSKESKERIQEYSKELQRVALYNVLRTEFNIDASSAIQAIEGIEARIDEVSKKFNGLNGILRGLGIFGKSLVTPFSALNSPFSALKEITKNEVPALKEILEQFKNIAAADDLFTENAETNIEKRIGLSKAEYDLLQARLKNQIKQQDEIAKDETKNEKEREKAVRKRTDFEIQSVNLEQRYKLQEAGKDLKNKEDIEAAKTKIVEDAIEKRRIAENKGTKDSFKLNVDYLQKLFNLYEAEHPSLIENGIFFSEDAYNKELTRITDLKNEQKSILEERYKNRENDSAQELAYKTEIVKINQQANDEIKEATDRHFSDEDRQRLLNFNNALETKRAQTNAELLEEEIKGENLYEVRQGQIDLEYEQKAASLENERELELAETEKTGADRQKIIAKYNALEEENNKKHAKAKKELDRAMWEALANGARKAFSDVASATKENTAVHKAAAVVVATIDTYQAANSAYAALAGIPIVGPALGAAAAAAAIAAGLANIQKILSVKTNDVDQKADELKSTSVNIGGYAEKGGVVKGKSHEQGGVAILAEGQEGIINKKAMKGNIPVMDLFKFINYGDYLKRSTVVPQPSYFNKEGGIMQLDYDTLAQKIASANAELLPQLIGESTAEANETSLPTPVVSVQNISTKSEETNNVQIRY